MRNHTPDFTDTYAYRLAKRAVFTLIHAYLHLMGGGGDILESDTQGSAVLAHGHRATAGLMAATTLWLTGINEIAGFSRSVSIVAHLWLKFLHAFSENSDRQMPDEDGSRVRSPHQLFQNSLGGVFDSWFAAVESNSSLTEN